MPKHFMEPWTKRDYIEDTIDMFDTHSELNEDKQETLRNGLYRMKRDELALLYRQVQKFNDHLKELIKSIK